MRSVDPNIPNMDFDKFSQFFTLPDSDSESDSDAVQEIVEPTEDNRLDQAVKLNVVEEERFQDGGSLTSMDSGIVENASKGEL